MIDTPLRLFVFVDDIWESWKTVSVDSVVKA